MRISRAAHEAILSETMRAGAEECCGLLIADPASPAGRIDAILPAANVAAIRLAMFEIDPARLIAAHRAERAGGPRIVGCYHSHPGGDPVPSATDAAQAEASGALWLIAGGRAPWDVRLWVAVSNGRVHGRFDPVALIVEPAP